MLSKYIQPENLSENLNELVCDVRSVIPTAVFGVQFTEKCHIASTLNLPVVFITRDEITARLAAKELAALSGKKSVYLPAKNDVLLYNKAFNKDALYARIGALFEISRGVDFVCATFESLLHLMPKRIDCIKIAKDNEYPFESLTQKLVKFGYKRVEEIEKRGEFTVRGDIFHLFPINCEAPVRIDFFGDEVESIRYFDQVGGTLEGSLNQLIVLPTVDFTIDDCEVAIIKSQLKKEISLFGVNIFADKAREIVGELTEKLDTDRAHPSLSFILPLLDSMKGNLRDYLGENAVVVYDECKPLNDSLNGVLKEHSERCLSLKRNCECFSFTVNQIKKPEQLQKELNFSRKLALQSLTASVNFFNPLKTYRINCTAIARYALKPEDFFEDLKNWKKLGYRVLVCCGNSERAERIFNMLEDRKIFSDLGDNFPQNFEGIKITSFYLANGFIYHDAKFVLIGTNDLFAKKDREKKIKRKRNDIYSAPEIGDFCVHEVHGIGIVRGMQKITTTDGTKDYVALEYKGGDMLYVCVDRMDSLTKYLGGEEKPTLSKIGGGEFERIKERVKASIARLTINLKQLYRQRAEQKGYCFSPDNEFTREFEESFEFDETEDQLQSISEIKQDMESSKVMDRLLCGDVGYGKTEVALRAAFKAMMDGKQVALIAPTTILTEQHYMTCVERFKNFGIRIGLLNRFRSQSDQAKTIYALKNGEIDIIIGTHRLFSKDIEFFDLGLLIIDEEQRFGVEHKEKIKLLKQNVDTLTLSATPIPRTLHMSLTGIRDISIISTPPTTRIPVQVFVLEESDALISDAVSKELSREGQTFILYNRVESINSFAAHIEALLPEARVVVGHGQMSEKQLEKNILAFYKKEYDVLVSTTIIENGVDIPSANTIIIIDADKMGLSTLYQLKGRVGRSDKMARAYFTYKSDKVLTEPAYKRLSALTEFSDLGSGFKIAMRDLEIRGAGNVLGKEQHGHMEKIGYELYSKLLKQQLGEVTANVQTEIDVGISAFIPESYVSSSAVRMDCYKQIAEIKCDEDENRIVNGMRENYGDLPQEALNLIKIARLKEYCSYFFIIKAQITKDKNRLYFKNIDSLNDEGLMYALNQFKDDGVLAFDENPYVCFEKEERTAEKGLELALQFLICAKNYKKNGEKN
ncbi:MAG: transcription-repair coupling factor [Clostridia bacterium]|nr:transcription-repair coupling factor [Clostridia bacterium]